MYMYQELYELLEKFSLPKTTKLRNFPEHRRATFGWVKERLSNKTCISYYSRKKPEVYKKLLEIGHKICKHEFTSIHVVRNLVSCKHKDGNNVGQQTLVSFGNYTGCKLVVEDEIIDAYEKPVTFNGYEKEHWNTDDLVGIKYSLIFYKIRLPSELEKYRIVIPSHKRAKILNEQTLTTLKNNGIDKRLIDVFVAAEEYDEYLKVLDPDLYSNLIVGEKGLVQQRNYIINYYVEGAKLLSLDDDIKDIDLQYTDYASLDEFICEAFEECKKNNTFIFSVNPVYNPYWRKDRLETKQTNLNYCIGAFFGIINRHDKDLFLITCVDGDKEDVERSILYYLKDGKTLIFNKIGFVTKYFGSDGGGLGKLKDRLERHKTNTIALCEKYPDLCKEKIIKNGLYEVKFYHK